MCLEIDGFKHSFVVILCCALAPVKVQPHPMPHWVRQISEYGKLFVIMFFRQPVLPKITYFSFSFISFSRLQTSQEKKNCCSFFSPRIIFNGDKSGFQFFPKPEEVLAYEGNKILYEVNRGLENASTTTPVFAFSLYIMTYPPMLIHPYKRVPSVMTQRFPDKWRLGHGRTGWMAADVVDDYIGNVFALHFGTYNVKSPLILFVDGHLTHLTYQLREICSQLGIIWIFLYPNTTRLIHH